MPTDVAAAAARALAEAGVEVHAVDAGVIAVALDAREARLDLGSLRRVLALAPAEQAGDRVAAWAAEAAAVLRGETPTGPVHARLLPRILPGPDPRLWSEPLVPGAAPEACPLHLALCEDLPGRARLLTPFDLPRLGLSLRDARQRALDHLRAVTPPPAPVDGDTAQWAVGDGCDAARMLLAAAFLPGPLGTLAVAPARDLCWLRPLRGPDDVRAATLLWLEARGLSQLPYALPPVLLWCHAGGHDAVRIIEADGQVRVTLPAALADALA